LRATGDRSRAHAPIHHDPWAVQQSTMRLTDGATVARRGRLFRRWRASACGGHNRFMIIGSYPRSAADICHAIAEGNDDALPSALALWRERVGADFASFSALPMRNPENALVLQDGRPPMSAQDRAEWGRLLITHPYARHVAEASDPAVRLTDVVDLRQFIGTEIYQVCLQPIGATYQAALRLSRRPDSFTLISVWRADRDFGERELEPALVFARALRAAWGLRLVLSQLASEASAVDVTTDPPLTARQAEVVSLVAQGLTNQQIAVRLQVTPRTVRKHVEDLFRRTGARSRTELAVRWTTAQCGISGSPRQNSISL
jgi:DNA-binding CsgD family transcriptional regulator